MPVCNLPCEEPDCVLSENEGVQPEKYTKKKKKKKAREKYFSSSSGYMMTVSRQQKVNIQLILWEIGNLLSGLICLESIFCLGFFFFVL